MLAQMVCQFLDVDMSHENNVARRRTHMLTYGHAGAHQERPLHALPQSFTFLRGNTCLRCRSYIWICWKIDILLDHVKAASTNRKRCPYVYVPYTAPTGDGAGTGAFTIVVSSVSSHLFKRNAIIYDRGFEIVAYSKWHQGEVFVLPPVRLLWFILNLHGSRIAYHKQERAREMPSKYIRISQARLQTCNHVFGFSSSVAVTWSVTSHHLHKKFRKIVHAAWRSDQNILTNQYGLPVSSSMTSSLHSNFRYKSKNTIAILPTIVASGQ